MSSCGFKTQNLPVHPLCSHLKCLTEFQRHVQAHSLTSGKCWNLYTEGKTSEKRKQYNYRRTPGMHWSDIVSVSKYELPLRIFSTSCFANSFGVVISHTHKKREKQQLKWCTFACLIINCFCCVIFKHIFSPAILQKECIRAFIQGYISEDLATCFLQLFS